MSEIRTQVQFVNIDEDIAGQRIDNFLRNKLKDVPKSVVYRILRKGEVRVNKKRIKPEYKLQPGDVIRIPPVTLPQSDTPQEPLSTKLEKVSELEQCILFEDDALLVLNKPSGTAVHGGSGLKFGVIEALRALRPQARFLELVHRIDRDTSGILLVAKKRSALRHLQAQFRDKSVQKYYNALVMGRWEAKCRKINAPLLKNEVNSIVRVNPQGKASETRFKVIEVFSQATLIQASPVTGRTHQIRVHTQYAGHPIAWDDRYGDPRFDAYTGKLGLNRLFLHAAQIRFIHPTSGETMEIVAPMEKKLERVLAQLRS
ncbi:23S rRNA pseudouridine(955/2504/2580) synthase RluC [Vibrio gazogenes]|uniref:Pseudouridine synthase n=1 Tax=Vibrio gazogenes DSM 21264 = NBRC 103151 TaxID=1123492 RepID=A0A1M4Y153_VIBGA|nr:23S rRNA pseudouridine(955/2504/2580) synthase RluC [Vibrio gazogenes]USP12820.1 23S rRNA pseudouridine(955/2504/2580) synthase RluC [Vibrio gazogenes]SHE99303.1 23S rRNA pseudouridine955/2504/2580 synthase [Vibrio gazogenes DSM 21264] [Vibrio gazogenes DSM 21264 = NBRC 103151]SJN56331.1 Ribosomal large subunit pseudouridine synthase C [Vibrio gazogenes]